MAYVILSAFQKLSSFFGAPLSPKEKTSSSKFLKDDPCPEELGFCPDRLGRLDRWVEDQVTSKRVAGMLVGVARNGKIALVSNHGYASAENKTPITDKTIFRIYSMTKPITSVAIMMLYEEGRFQLDDPISKFAPMFSKMKVAVSGKFPNIETVDASPITFQHLLTQTSGLTYSFIPDEFGVNEYYKEHKIYFTSLEAGAPKTDSLESTCQRLAEAPLLFQPGSLWTYGVSTDVLGYLVEIISGMPFERFVKERILLPLGMHDTDFYVPEEKSANLASCYMFAEQKSLDLREGGFATQGSYRLLPDGSHAQPPSCPSGGGGLVSTLPDYLRFCQMLLNGGVLDATRLLAPATVNFMLTNHLRGDMADVGKPTFLNMNRSGQGFGLGFAVVLSPPRLACMCQIGDASWGGMASTFFFIDPANGIACVLLTQLVPSSTYNFRR